MFLKESCDCITRRSSAQDVFTFDCRPMFFFLVMRKKTSFFIFFKLDYAFIYRWIVKQPVSLS